MKQDVQLYIDGQQIDLFEDESFQITSKIQDVRDVSKVFTDFSASFSIKASRNNNLVFKHYHDNTITNGYDARYYSDAVIEINHQPFRKGKVRLDGIQMKNNRAYAYKITFYGNTLTLKEVLGDDLLSDIDFSDYDTPYSDYYVPLRLEGGITYNSIPDAIICPMISAGERWYYNSSSGSVGNLASVGDGATWNNFKYAIRIPAIIREIQQTYPEIQFSTDFFNSDQTDYYNLYMWMHREAGVVSTGTYSEYIEGWGTQVWGGFTTQGDLFTISDTPSPTYYYNVTLNLDTAATSEVYTVNLYRNGVKVQTHSTKTGDASISFGSLTNGGYKIEVLYQNTFTVYGDNVSETNLYVQKVDGSGSSYNTFYKDTDTILGTLFNFEVSANLPEIKVLDFLTGLFKMFNLTAYEEDGVIVVRTLDEYYANYDNTFDITQYVDISDSSINSSTLFKTIQFRYKGLGSYLTEKHKELFNTDWATEEYALDDKFIGTDYTVEVPFEHMKFERLYDQDLTATDAMWGWMVKNVNSDYSGGTEYVGDPLLFYAVKQTSATSVKIKKNSTTTTITQYYIPSNSVGLTDSQSINFKSEINEFAEVEFNQTLFDTYYKSYIEDVFDYRSRLTKVTAYLPLKILTRMKLNDVFIIGDKDYRINSSNINLSTGKTEFELLYKL